CTAGHPVCDLQGICESSGFITNTCIPEACWDAGLPPTIDAGPVDARADASATDDAMQFPDAAPGTTSFAPVVGSDLSANDRFGSTVAIDGDTAVFGASGAVYVFSWNNGSWGAGIKLKPLEATGFGTSIGISGTTMVVGAASEAYVFEQSAQGFWIQGNRLTSGVSYDSFGQNVAIDGDIIVVGAPGDDAIATNSGAVHIFRRNSINGSWDLESVERQPSPASGDFFGSKVTVNGTYVAGQGLLKTHVFEYAGGTTWTSSSAYSGGNSISISGSVLAIGKSSTNVNTGSVLIYRRTGAVTWSLEATLTASDAATYARFGSAIALDGTRVVVGAPTHEPDGRIYSFANSGASWTEHPESLIPPQVGNGDEYGHAVALSGNRIAIGAPGDASMAGSGFIASLP
ncbi:MAG TPA: FG-GAP repeat protein, partial [Kofleriaceae bacterium]|nr:FG-GAP repeat protein [Kofleriaceae bacterium]